MSWVRYLGRLRIRAPCVLYSRMHNPCCQTQSCTFDSSSFEGYANLRHSYQALRTGMGYRECRWSISQESSEKDSRTSVWDFCRPTGLSTATRMDGLTKKAPTISSCWWKRKEQAYREQLEKLHFKCDLEAANCSIRKLLGVVFLVFLLYLGF